MKKLLTAFLLLSVLPGVTQTYSFQQTTGTYTDLTGATILTTSAPWSYATAFTVPVGFTFNFMGSNFSSVNIEGSGFAYFDPNYYYLLLPYGVRLQSKGTSGMNSPISYLHTGTAPNRICKMEWKNAGFYYDTTQTVNFQLWLYETSNKIEVKIGSSTVSNPAVVFNGNGSNGPVVSVSRWTSFTNCAYGLSLTGNPATAATQQLSGNVNIFTASLNAPPAAGTVYIFQPGALDVSIQNDLLLPEIINDFARQLITLRSSSPGQFIILDGSGKVIMNERYVPGETGIVTSSWSAGIYSIRIVNSYGRATRRVAIIR